MMIESCSSPPGHVDNANDCDDTCAVCWTGATETCDTADNDCDATVDEGVETTFYRDADGDGRGDPASAPTACAAPAGHVGDANDCDDSCAVCWAIVTRK